MPRAVYVLALGIFAMVTSEFVVAGLMPQMADGLDATIPEIGYLITAFAMAMAFGGPFLTMAVTKARPKQALMVLFAIFLFGNILAATASGYAVMVVARVVTGVAAQAMFGVSISVCAQLTRPEVRGRAVSVVLNGLMLGTLLGLPLSTLVGERLGWRAAFWVIYPPSPSSPRWPRSSGCRTSSGPRTAGACGRSWRCSAGPPSGGRCPPARS